MTTTFPQPRPKTRTRSHPYVFKEMANYTHQTAWTLRTPFVSKWLEISTTGLVTVKANEHGYAWDGCTPKFSFLNLFIIGVPDGHIDICTMKPFTYHATMVHDALYQYLDSIPITKNDVDLNFLHMMGRFQLRHVYYLFAKYFGGKGVVQRGLPT